MGSDNESFRLFVYYCYYYPTARGMGIRIKPFACRRRRKIKGNKLSYTKACCVLSLLACSEAYEFGQLGTGM